MVRRVVQLHKLYQQLPECRRAEPIPLWVADYRSVLGYNGSYAMWQYTGSGSAGGISGACDLDRSYKDFLPEIRAGGYNNYGVSALLWRRSAASICRVQRPVRVFYTANFNDVSATCRWAITAW